MSNSSEEYWSLIVGGVETSLHQFGWSVTTVGGSRYDLPTRRGENMRVAYRPGQVYRRKLPDARPITLIMWMVGWDPATGPAVGSVPNTSDQRTQWNDNWDFLRRLVYRPNLLDGRISLVRRWFLTSPTFPVTRTGSNVIQGDPGVPAPGVQLLRASAAAEMVGTMAPSMTGRTRSDFSLEFTLPDPYFFGDLVTATLHPGDTSYVWNNGHDVSNYLGISVDLVGPLTNPVLTNTTTNPDSWVKFTGTIPAGQTVTLTPGAFGASQHPNASTTPVINKIAAISNGGAEFWVNVLPGANTFTLTGTGSGYALLKFQPPYV